MILFEIFENLFIIKFLKMEKRKKRERIRRLRRLHIFMGYSLFDDAHGKNYDKHLR